MSEACERLHFILSKFPLYRAKFTETDLPKNGLYFLFENREFGHGVNRIVRVGTHRGQDNLVKRIQEHLYTQNKDRSIFRKHVGRCLLNRDKDPFLSQWEIDLTKRDAKEKFDKLINKELLKKAEDAVSQYMISNFSFVVLQVDDEKDRLEIEKSAISTIAQCVECAPSKTWLGLYHPKAIKENGIWNIQGLKGTPFGKSDIDRIFNS